MSAVTERPSRDVYKLYQRIRSHAAETCGTPDEVAADLSVPVTVVMLAFAGAGAIVTSHDETGAIIEFAQVANDVGEQERANRAILVLWNYHVERVGAERVYEEPQRDSLIELLADLTALAKREAWATDA